MTDQPAIVVTIAPNGDTKIDAQCFTGSACTEATAALEQVLTGTSAQGRRAISREYKQEYYAAEDETEVTQMRF